jgi:hypothetical protein
VVFHCNLYRIAENAQVFRMNHTISEGFTCLILNPGWKESWIDPYARVSAIVFPDLDLLIGEAPDSLFPDSLFQVFQLLLVIGVLLHKARNQSLREVWA